MSKTKKQKQPHDPSKCIPNANIRDYFIYIYPDVPEKCTGGYIGFVGNYSNEDLRLYIEIDDAFMREKNHRAICFCFDCNNHSGASIVITSSFWEELKQNEFLYASIWHEVGHYHTTRYFNTPFVSKSAQKYREDFLSRGEIIPEEKTADLFALYYTSKENVINDINWLIKTRKAIRWEPEDKKLRAVYELGRRKRYLNSFNSKEEIENELCRLCGVADFDSI